MVCSEEKLHFFNFNTDSRISLCVREHYLKYVKPSNSFFRFFNFLYLLEKMSILLKFKSLSFIGNRHGANYFGK